MAETTGVNALPLVLLISFLVGLIMAFQAAFSMSLFGADIIFGATSSPCPMTASWGADDVPCPGRAFGSPLRRDGHHGGD